MSLVELYAEPELLAGTEAERGLHALGVGDARDEALPFDRAGEVHLMAERLDVHQGAGKRPLRVGKDRLGAHAQAIPSLARRRRVRAKLEPLLLADSQLAAGRIEHALEIAD